MTYQKHPRVEQKFKSLFRVYYSGEIHLTDADAGSHSVLLEETKVVHVRT